jgi:hypothetical protein
MKKNIYIYFLLFSTAIFAQKQVVTSIDTIKNKIGAEFKLTLKTDVDTMTKVVFPNLKNIGALEVIESYKIDTIKKNNRYELIKKYGLTQFDSGMYVIPSVKILINNKPFLSDSIAVEVANVPVDTLKQKMYDIKDIVPAENQSNNWWKYVLGLLLLVGLGALIYFLIKKHQKKKIEEETFKTPIEKATNLLNTLEKKELWQKGEIKSYYSELTDITRNYIEEAIEIPAMESTTSELIVNLKKASQKKKMKLSQETIDNLERVLKQADLVKFAKSKPLDFEITEDRNKIQRAILTLDKSIPAAILDQDADLLNEAQRQEQIKIQLQQKRKKRLYTSLGILGGVVVGSFIVSVLFYGFTEVKDTLLMNSSKQLLEGEWIKSEYGNPSIALETPKVLKRTDMTKLLPKEGLALIKEMQTFTYGNFFESFYIMVSTFSFKQDMQIDLAKSLEGSVKMMEMQGGQNMMVKQEEFETKEGIKGMKGYGTFSAINPITRSSTKFYFEILVFSQNSGLQQIIILHEEGDSYTNQIADRVLNSVELKQASN